MTGEASGIGLAASRCFAAMGLKVCLADLSQQALEAALEEVAAASPEGKSAVMAVPTDSSGVGFNHIGDPRCSSP